MGLGTGGFKANISPLVAEQYKRTKLFIGHTRSGERVIVDPVMTTSKIYMYFYMFINVGALIGQITMAYSEKVRFQFSFVSHSFLTNFSLAVCWLLACVHTPHHRVLPVPHRALLRSQHVQHFATERLGSLSVTPHLASGSEGPVVVEPGYYLEAAERPGLLGEGDAKPLQR